MNLRLLLLAVLCSLPACVAEDDDEDLAALAAALNQLPTVSLTAPLAGQTFPHGGTISVSASAADGDGTVTLVEFFANGTKIGQDATAPYRITWPTPSTGSYELAARATDNTQGKRTSPPVRITFAVNQLPWPWIELPVNDLAFEPGTPIPVVAGGMDPDGAVVRLEVFANGVPIGQVLGGASLRFSWTGAAAGTYDLTVRATDNSGGMRTNGGARIVVRSFAGGICEGVPRYAQAGGYQVGSEVQSYGHLYACRVGGPNGCNGAAALVEPLVGADWGTYWTWVSRCLPDPCLMLPAYVAASTYAAGDRVKHQGDAYECLVAGWCSSPAAWAYAPGEGAHWDSAWRLVERCQ